MKQVASLLLHDPVMALALAVVAVHQLSQTLHGDFAGFARLRTWEAPVASPTFKL